MTDSGIRYLTVPGKPVPAVRMTQRSKHYNKQAQRYLAYKDRIGWAWRYQHPGVEPLTGDVSLTVIVVLSKPDKRRWDVSNVLKAIEDGLNKIAYVDDKQIADARITVCGICDWIDVDELPRPDYVFVEVKGF